MNNLKNNGEIIIGGNIGKNKNTPNHKAIEDYIYLIFFGGLGYFLMRHAKR